MNIFDWFFIGALVGVLSLAITLGIIQSTTISPIDVYQGKTTLKYEVVDGIKVDSVVVWKDDFKK